MVTLVLKNVFLLGNIKIEIAKYDNQYNNTIMTVMPI